jgi:hypothetical protein
MTNYSTSDITSALRSIQSGLRDHDMPVVSRMYRAANQLSQLETTLPSRDPSAFTTENLTAFGYNTVLGYLNDTDPLALLEMADPVRDTIPMGMKIAARCHAKGLKVVKVPACEHVKARYAKVTHVNAYPIAVLAEVLDECTSSHG